MFFSEHLKINFFSIPIVCMKSTNFSHSSYMLTLDLNYNNFNVKSNHFPTDHSTDIVTNKIILCIWKYTDLLLLLWPVYSFKVLQAYLYQPGSKGKEGRGITALHSTIKPEEIAFYQCSTILFGRLTLGYNRKRTLSGVCCISLGSLPVMHYQQIFLRRDKPLVGIPHRNKLATLNTEKKFPFKWEWLSTSVCKAFWFR